MTKCCHCKKEFPLEKMFVQLTIFLAEELYCETCWDKLIEKVDKDTLQ
jgi:hypothetical protein